MTQLAKRFVALGELGHDMWACTSMASMASPRLGQRCQTFATPCTYVCMARHLRLRARMARDLRLRAHMARHLRLCARMARHLRLVARKRIIMATKRRPRPEAQMSGRTPPSPCGAHHSDHGPPFG